MIIESFLRQIYKKCLRFDALSYNILYSCTKGLLYRKKRIQESFAQIIPVFGQRLRAMHKFLIFWA